MIDVLPVCVRKYTVLYFVPAGTKENFCGLLTKIDCRKLNPQNS